MTEKDRECFSKLMWQMETVAVNNKQPLTVEKIDFYFKILQDLSFKEIEKNAVLYFRNKNAFFPSPADLRGQDPLQQQAQVAWNRIKMYLDHFYDPSIGSCMMMVIEKRMQKNGEGHLYPLLVQWGPEIRSTTAIAATRKLFLDAYKNNRKVEEKKQFTTDTMSRELKWKKIELSSINEK